MQCFFMFHSMCRWCIFQRYDQDDWNLIKLIHDVQRRIIVLFWVITWSLGPINVKLLYLFKCISRIPRGCQCGFWIMLVAKLVIRASLSYSEGYTSVLW